MSKTNTAPAQLAIVEPEQTRKEIAVVPSASLLQMAVSRGASLEEIRELRSLQKEMEADDARKAFNRAFALFKAEPIEIIKRKRVYFESKNGGAATEYWHAELSDVTAAVGPALAKHGLSYRWNVKQGEANKVTVTCILAHELGHAEEVTMVGGPDASGNKNPIQQVGSAATYLQRYTLLAITGLSTKGEDNDGRGGEDEEPLTISFDQALAIRDALAAAGKKEPALLKHLKLEKLEDLHAANYQAVLDLIGPAKAGGA